MKVGIAKEVLVGSKREVVIAGGSKPMSDEKLFATSCFSRSPGEGG